MRPKMTGRGPHLGFKVPPMRADAIADMATGLRDAFDVNGPRFDAEGTLERLSTYGVTLDVLGDDDPDLPAGVDACWVPDIVTLVMRESVYTAACAEVPRALFTVAHELGHLALGHRRTFNRETNCEILTIEDSEWQANTFAGAFLMPYDLIIKYGIKSVSEMMATFGVSARAAEIRLSKLRKKGRL